MLRGLILLLLGVALTVVVVPFVLTSRALDKRGITIPGRVYHKSETIRVAYSGWERSRDATIEYSIPETGGVSFFHVHPDVQQYDAMHTHQAVEIRYLPRREVPKVPLAQVLWDIHALPSIRLVNLQETSRLAAVLTPRVLLVCEIMGGLAGLVILWRITRWKSLGWLAVIGMVAVLAFLFVQDFPRPTRAPSVEVRRGSGHVTSVGRIDRLFSGAHERGLLADQPVDVVGVEFVPEARTEPVVAVDLVDRGSVSGLKERSAVTLAYEAGSPRTAYIEGATRRFPERNFSGALIQGALCLAMIIGLFAASQWIGRAFNRLIAR